MTERRGDDGQEFADIEADGGLGVWLVRRSEDLRKEDVSTPAGKAGVDTRSRTATKRPLGIPTIRDRVVQMAAVLVLEPIFEADLQPEQYAYRAGRSTLDAVRQVERLLRTGYTEVVDADLIGLLRSRIVIPLSTNALSEHLPALSCSSNFSVM